MNVIIFIYFNICWSEVTAVTVADVQAAEDNVFTTTVATSGSLPEHMLVGQQWWSRYCTCSVSLCICSLCCQVSLNEQWSGQRAASLFSHPDLVKLMFLIIQNHEQPQRLIALKQSDQTCRQQEQSAVRKQEVLSVTLSLWKLDGCRSKNWNWASVF